ncbi:lasso peptide biosynthesis B2 protein [Candidatus Viadribacter manganicus]|uniref:Microcin J25-processing protein McjB C-terminal domain-containing protein n=1 Tax=Candidatus Viadribacter manganicus TaxID=1759059 RepID=A0A1B1AH99_9PROT|nr:lasso peptide biosynthesis B2 protein [Candidatus Viadribacter manganicus]ANP45910.1 hypothetical protein ATE48_08235 [Candidatus Viadribacter manganicus]
MDDASRIELIRLFLPRRVYACIAGDWIVFLDAVQDRYFAMPADTDLGHVRANIAERGVRDGASPHAISRLAPNEKARSIGERALARLPDMVLVIEAACWAHWIIKDRRLAFAFDWIEVQKRALDASASLNVSAIGAHSVFERARVWIPKRYVCLFNALTLIRFLLRKRVRASLVFGVRAMPFAAHCWVVVDGRILDAGEEDCASFSEIVRL